MKTWRMRVNSSCAGRASRGYHLRAALAWLVAASLPLLIPAAARAVVLIPSVGLTRSVDSDETQSQIGLALRGTVLPGILHSEIGAGYRKDRYADGALEVTQVPITASLLVTPIPTIHADAGVGWYNTHLDYQSPALRDETTQKFGTHVGGGFLIPLAPSVGVDMTGRYVFLQKQESRLVPGSFNPNYWTLSLGFAFQL